MYEHVRTFTRDEFRLDLWDTGRTDHLGKTILRYALFDGTQPFGKGIVFEGEDFACSPLHAIDSDEAVADLLGFLSLKDGDTDSEYFEAYTPAQIAWRDRRAEDLQLIVLEIEEAHERC